MSRAAAETGAIATRLLAWLDRHGRRDLPWQDAPTPYAVWVSEIMLQQTRVATVIPYYRRFMARFPDLPALAEAEIDEVLHLWSGLGYYARARHLHRAAGEAVNRHAGRLPTDLAALQALPGIGRSTAGAILALAHGQRQAILDGNVKRVLARYHAIEGWPGTPRVLATLWGLAEHHTPRRRVAAYTQAIMDLGATLCTRTRPDCGRCPLRAGCAARAEGRQAELPGARPRRALPVRQARLLILRRPGGEVLLERRPPTGVWGGLWVFPECEPGLSVPEWCRLRLGVPATDLTEWPAFRHTFSHFHLDISPVLARVSEPLPGVLDGDRRLWYKGGPEERLGLAAPVLRILDQLSAPGGLA